MTISKKLGSKGAVTVPQQLRHIAGIQPGAPIDIEDTSDGLIIRKHIPSCCFCGGVESVATVEDIEICAKCAKRLSTEAAGKLGQQDE